MKLRRFNDEGLARFGDYLERLRTEDPRLDPPTSLLTDDRFSASIDSPIEVEPQPFAQRMDFACWLNDAATEAGAEIPRTDKYFWAWLSLALFDQVCPVVPKIRWKCPFQGKKGRFVGATLRHIPDFSAWKRRYRHLLANPYDIYRAHEKNPWRAMVALVNPLHEPGELTEQFASRIELITCPGSLALATRLYINKETGERRKGASGNAARRFGKVMNQYTRTFDLPEIEPTNFSEMLPKEFKPFVNAAKQVEASPSV